MARFIFTLIPALLVGLSMTVIHPAIGFIVFGTVFYGFWGICEPRPERGEGKTFN